MSCSHHSYRPSVQKSPLHDPLLHVQHVLLAFPPLPSNVAADPFPHAAVAREHHRRAASGLPRLLLIQMIDRQRRSKWRRCVGATPISGLGRGGTLPHSSLPNYFNTLQSRTGMREAPSTPPLAFIFTEPPPFAPKNSPPPKVRGPAQAPPDRDRRPAAAPPANPPPAHRDPAARGVAGD